MRVFLHALGALAVVRLAVFKFSQLGIELVEFAERLSSPRGRELVARPWMLNMEEERTGQTKSKPHKSLRS